MSDTPSQLDTKLAALVDTIINATKAAGDFAMEQLPDLAMQLVMYGRAMSTSVLIISIALLWFCWWCGKRSMGYDREIMIVPCMMSGLVGVLLFFFSLHDFMLSWFAPKIYIIKEVASLLK